MIRLTIRHFLATALLLGAASISEAQRGMWVWDSGFVLPSATERHKLVNACVDNSITDIYLYLDKSHYVSKESQISALIAEATCANVHVWGLEGYRGYFSDVYGPQTLYDTAQELIDYNNRVLANQRFVGLHTDQEPQDGQGVGPNTFHNGKGDANLSTTPGSGVWKNTEALDREYLMRDWVEMHEELSGMLHAAGLELGAAVTSWPDDYFGGPVSCTYNSVTQGVYKHLMNYIDDYVVMSYSTNPSNAAGRVVGELTYADTLDPSVRPRVYASLETHTGSGAVTSYGDHATKNSKTAVFTDMDTIAATLGTHPSFSGISIHDWVGWRTLSPATTDSSDRGLCSGPPSASGISLSGSSATNATSVDFTVVFSKSVQGVTTSNFSLNPTLVGASISTANPVGALPASTWKVSVNTGTAEGLIGLQMVNGTGIEDADSNALSTTNLPLAGPSFTIDRTPPTSSLSAPEGAAGGAITGTYTATDSGAGVASARLYTRLSTGNWTDSGPVSGGTFSFTPTGSGDAADGLYYLQVAAIDGAGNAMNTPSGASGTGSGSISYNSAANTPMTHQLNDGAMPSLLFPINLNLSVRVNFTGGPIAGNGAITVERKGDDFSPATDAGLDVNRLLQQYWNVTTTGSFTFATATLMFVYNDTLLGSDLASESDIDVVYGIDGTVATAYRNGDINVNTATNTITVTGVDEFSSWFAGSVPASSIGSMFLIY